MGAGDDELARLQAASRVVRTVRADGEPVLWCIWDAAERAAPSLAPVFVLLHGSFGSWTHWARNIAALREAATIVAVDAPGFGGSGLAPKDRMPEDMGRELGNAWRRLCELEPALGDPLRPILIAGFSLGAIYAGWMARYLLLNASEHGAQSIAGLVLVAPGGLGSRRNVVFPLKAVPRDGDAAEARRMEVHRHNLSVLMMADSAKIDALALRIQDENVLRATFRGSFTDHPETLLAALEGLRMPVLGIWGERDAFDDDVRCRMRALTAVVPQAETAVIQRAGHWLLYEEPAHANAIIISWVYKIIP